MGYLSLDTAYWLGKHVNALTRHKLRWNKIIIGFNGRHPAVMSQKRRTITDVMMNAVEKERVHVHVGGREK